MSTPSLTRVDPTLDPGAVPRAVTLMLHGGTQRSTDQANFNSNSLPKTCATTASTYAREEDDHTAKSYKGCMAVNSACRYGRW